LGAEAETAEAAAALRLLLLTRVPSGAESRRHSRCVGSWTAPSFNMSVDRKVRRRARVNVHDAAAQWAHGNRVFGSASRAPVRAVRGMGFAELALAIAALRA
jgi:hypothetical protein